ncbi:carbohydrate sulfotransferase 11-like isoform X2 [Zootermopsis nevadensis]|nr:carbohydrate sulfotransferase 11-like isoform X2 [Zootermopsis nevadensis]
MQNTGSKTQKATISFKSGKVIQLVNNEPEDDGYDLEDLESELEGRRHRVWEVCVARGLNTEGKPNAWEFFIDPTHSLIWCNIFKAASSTWLYNFNLLGGYKEKYLRQSKKNPLVLARSNFPRPTIKQLQEALPKSLSFLIVREPFERLLSAYRNKIEGLPHRFYRKMGREIVAKYRKSNSPPNVINPTPTGPTFSEFVNYITDTAGSYKVTKFDEHWAPYYSFCTPCQVNFTVIAKLETLTRDQEYIIRRAGLENILKLSRHKDRPKMILNKARDGKNTNDLTRRYYGQLSKKQLKKLHYIYGLDFEMFGYNVTKYYEIVKEDT